MTIRCVESELELLVDAILNITLNCPTPPPFITLAEMKNSPPEDDDYISSFFGFSQSAGLHGDIILVCLLLTKPSVPSCDHSLMVSGQKAYASPAA